MNLKRKLSVTALMMGLAAVLNAEPSWNELNRQMIQWVKSGQSAKAIETGEALVKNIRGEFRDKKRVSAESVIFLVNQGIICKQNRKYEAAREVLELAIECKAKIASLNDPLFVTIYKALGEIYLELKDFEQGEEFFLKALHIKEINLGKEHSDSLPLYLSLSDFYQKAERNEEAFSILKKASEISRRSGKESLKAEVDFQLGEYYFKQKNYETAQESFFRALGIYEQTKDYKKISNIYDYFGTLNMIKGDLKEAESYYRLSMKNKEKSSGKNSVDYAKSLNNLAKIYLMQDKKEAEPLLKESLGICEGLLGKNHPSFVFVLSNLVDFYVKNSNPSEAEIYKKYLSRIRKSEG